jgi:glutathione peroxidase
MKKYFYTVLVLAFVGVLIYSFSEAKSKSMEASYTALANTSFHELKVLGIDGKTSINMIDFKGKYVLCVNVASECGYTKQYGALQQLADTYKEKLVVIGFPCNQFGKQEPGDAEEIKNFCSLTYDVKFPLFEKIDVNGSDAHPLYCYLKSAKPGLLGSEAIKWIFTKFLVNRQGEVV